MLKWIGLKDVARHLFAKDVVAASVRKRATQVVGPDHEGEQARPKAQLRIAHRKEPRSEPQTADADRCLASSDRSVGDIGVAYDGGIRS